MKFLKYQIKNFSITQQQSSVITNQLKQKLNTARKSHRQFISLKTNYADDFIGLTNLIGNNFNLKNTSQVYNTQEKYLGYLELESSLNENVLKSQLESFVEQYGIDMESASFDIVNEIPDRNLLRDKKRFSLFNKKGISSIVSANLYYRWLPGDGGQLFGDELERNQDYGVILDRVSLL